MNPQDPRTSGQPASRRKQQRTAGYRYYLEDHPVLAPVVTLLLGGLCLYATVFSNLLRNLLVGSDPDNPMVENFNKSTGWGIAFVFAIMVLAFIFLLINLVEMLVRRTRRKPAICPRCGLMEVRRYLRFVHDPVDGTDWENIICPQCGNIWYGRR